MLLFDNYVNGVIGKSMNKLLHPIEERFLSIRELLHLMGMPEDFELNDPKRNYNHIAQNVPVTTARD
jgi:site-specific DNA-cytosine methylase